MASKEERFLALIEKHLGISDPSVLDKSAADAGVNSMDIVDFLKKVNEEFNVNITADDAANLSTFRDALDKYVS